MDIDNFQGFEDLLGKFSTGIRRDALREAARYLMLSNRKRLRLNVQPSGNAMQARKNGTNKKMFTKLGKHMQKKDSGGGMAVGYFGSTGNIATNHQLGKELRRSLSGGRTLLIDLPVRELLGLDAEDRQAVEQIFLKHMDLES